MVKASNGHFLVQMLQPMQSSSEIHASLSVAFTSMQSFPIRTTGQDLLHSCRHFLGLHLSAFTTAIRALPPSSSCWAFFLSRLGGMIWYYKRNVQRK